MGQTIIGFLEKNTIGLCRSVVGIQQLYSFLTEFSLVILCGFESVHFESNGLLAQEWVVGDHPQNLLGNEETQRRQQKKKKRGLNAEWSLGVSFVSQRLRKFPEIRPIFLMHRATVLGGILQVLFWVYWINVGRLFQCYGTGGPDSGGYRIPQDGLWILVEVCK